MKRIVLQPRGAAAPTAVRVDPAPQHGPHALAVQLGDDSAVIEWMPHGTAQGLVRVAGQVLPYQVCVTQRGIEVWVAGRVTVFEIVDRSARRADPSTSVVASERVAAPMPGSILEVRAVAGQSFKAHAPLVIMESMKMEMTLSVPHDGVVAEVRCAPGDMVDSGAILVTLEAADD